MRQFLLNTFYLVKKSLRSFKLTPDEPPVTTYILDTLTAANGTQIQTRPPDIDVSGAGWRKDALGVIAIQSNRGIADTVPGSIVYSIDSTIARNKLDIVIFLNSAVNNIGPLVRYQDSNNYFLGFINFGSQALELYEVIAGSFNLRASTAFTNINGVDYPLTIDNSLNRIDVSSGSSTIGYNSISMNTLTRVGVTTGSNLAGMDDFKVTDL